MKKLKVFLAVGLLCRTIYDYEKINLEKWNNRQTKLFNDG